MKVYQGISGGIYHVADKRLGRGGEGSVHEIENFPGHVAKIFKENKRDAAREEKLCKMVQNTVPEEMLKCVTWPKDVLYDQDGFVGYVMQRVKNISSLSELYSNNKYDLRTRLIAAYNLCAAIDTIHSAGQVCGDLNPRNICINLDQNDADKFQVILVDADSYHFITDEKIYRCEVGLADYLAPEMQKKFSGGITLRNAQLPTFTKATDLFALAVHVFCLLMNGSHPFACAREENGNVTNTMEQMTEMSGKESVVAPQPIDNIKNGFFPFYDKQPGIDIPAYAPEFASLEPSLQRLFVQTFVEGYQNPGKRVHADEWLAALKPLIDDIQNTITRCGKGHYYFSCAARCPYCDIEEKVRRLISGIGPTPSVQPPESKDSPVKPPKPPEGRPPEPPTFSPPPKRGVVRRIIDELGVFWTICLMLMMLFFAYAILYTLL